MGCTEHLPVATPNHVSLAVSGSSSCHCGAGQLNTPKLNNQLYESIQTQFPNYLR